MAVFAGDLTSESWDISLAGIICIFILCGITVFFGEYQERAANESRKIKTADRFGLSKAHRENDP